MNARKKLQNPRVLSSYAKLTQKLLRDCAWQRTTCEFSLIYLLRNYTHHQFLNSLRCSNKDQCAKKIYENCFICEDAANGVRRLLSGPVIISNELWLRCSLCLRIKVEAVAATGIIRKQSQNSYGRGDQETKTKQSS